MTPDTFNLLFVGPQGPFRELIDHLEAQENYHVHFATEYEDVFPYLNEGNPGAIVLAAPTEERNIREMMYWLNILKSRAPVLVLSPAEDIRLNLAVMDQGAFDFFTAFTPLDSVDWIINNAVSRTSFQAA